MTQSSSVNWQALMIGMIAVFAVIAYAFMVHRSTRYTVISMLILGAFAAFAAIVFGTVVLPYLTFKPQPAQGLRKYSDLEMIGRNVYRSEGCWYCHTQFVREVDWDLGPVSTEGDYVFDAPAMLGSERTGPDLSNEGGKYPDEWHRAHHRDPQSMAAGSIMPKFEYLERMPINEIDSVTRKEARDSNGKLKPFIVNDPKEGLRPATQMDALIAYVQSMGTRRKQVAAGQELEVPDYYKFVYNDKTKKYDPRAAPASIPLTPVFANQGRGMYNNLCAPCHGLEGYGDGPAGRDFVVKPANFHLPQFKKYSEAKWYWRVQNGVPGARMPAWKSRLNAEQTWYIIRYLQSIANPEDVKTSAPEGSAAPPSH